MAGSKNPQRIKIFLLTKLYDAVIFNSAYNLYLMLNQFFGNPCFASSKFLLTIVCVFCRDLQRKRP